MYIEVITPTSTRIKDHASIDVTVAVLDRLIDKLGDDVPAAQHRSEVVSA